MINSTNDNTMNITANDLKTKWISSFENALESYKELFVTVRWRKKYVLLDIDQYEKMRDFELKSALEDIEWDLKTWNFSTSVDLHLNSIKNAL